MKTKNLFIYKIVLIFLILISIGCTNDVDEISDDFNNETEVTSTLNDPSPGIINNSPCLEFDSIFLERRANGDVFLVVKASKRHVDEFNLIDAQAPWKYSITVTTANRLTTNVLGIPFDTFFKGDTKLSKANRDDLTQLECNNNRADMVSIKLDLSGLNTLPLGPEVSRNNIHIQLVSSYQKILHVTSDLKPVIGARTVNTQRVILRIP